MKIFPSSHEKLMTVAILAFALGALFGLLANINDDHPEVVVTALATLAAAFFGAWYAFKKQNKHEVLEQTKRNVEAANRAIFAVYTLWDIQKSYQREVLALYHGRPDIWVLLQMTPITNFGYTNFNVDRLDFLLSSEHAPVYRDLIQEERRYEIFRQLVEHRNELVINKLRPVMVKLGITHLRPSDIPKIETYLGPDITGNLKDTTNHIVKFNDENITSLEIIYTKLYSAVKSIFPDQEFVTLNFDD